MIMRWTGLTEEQEMRLANCRSRKSDIVPIARCYKKEKGISSEDALILTLEHLDSNGQYFDPSKEEYDRMLCQI